MKQEKLFKHAEDEFIGAIIYHRMWSSDACWKTIGAVIEGLKNINYKKDKLGALKDNVQNRYLGLVWEKFKTQWSKLGLTLSIVDLTNNLKDLMRLGKKWLVPEKPDVSVPQQIDMYILGQRTKQVLELDIKAN